MSLCSRQRHCWALPPRPGHQAHGSRRLRKHLVDVKRSQSYTRYFLAERVGGNPANMGWESQAVMLVPEAQLAQVLNSPNDVPIIDALKQV